MPESRKPNLSRRAMIQGAVATAGGLALSQSGLLAAAVQQQAKAPFPYVRAKAYHIPPETNTEESGYFSLCEGRNGKIYREGIGDDRLLARTEAITRPSRSATVTSNLSICRVPVLSTMPTGAASPSPNKRRR